MNNSENSTIALVTGANRGIGLEVVRQLAEKQITVFLGSRDLKTGQKAAEKLIPEELKVISCQLDVTHIESINRLVKQIEQRFSKLDILVNNAGILYDTWQQAIDADLDVVQQAWNTNTLGAWRMVQAFLPLMKNSNTGRIVNVSSGAGTLTSMGSGTPAYSVSKVALNALTRMLAAELKETGILINSVCPGWVATDMGGNGGRPIEDGAKGIVWAATLTDPKITGGFFRDGKPLAW